MSVAALLARASDKTRFQTVEDYVDFARNFLAYVPTHLQAVIVSRNEPQYTFWQYREADGLGITRPINRDLMYATADVQRLADFVQLLGVLRDAGMNSAANRQLVNRAIYTLQQCIGATLDALPAGETNKARKINGDLFERLIRLLLVRAGVDCKAGVVKVPISIDGEVAFEMNYQHDLIIRQDALVKVIGSVKTSSKDRIDKIFIDKFLFTRLTSTAVPHVAIFLNDVQRKDVRNPRGYGISSTFLPGHFKGYTVKLNPLDGVYYCDIRPNMRTEPILRDHIKTFDHFLFEDLWELMTRGAVAATVEVVDG